MIAILQFGVAVHYWHEAQSIQTKNIQQLSEGEDGWFRFHEVFNNSTKSYVSIVEKSVKGVIELAKAMGEIGAMTGKRRRKR